MIIRIKFIIVIWTIIIILVIIHIVFSFSYIVYSAKQKELKKEKINLSYLTLFDISYNLVQ